MASRSHSNDGADFSVPQIMLYGPDADPVGNEMEIQSMVPAPSADRKKRHETPCGSRPASDANCRTIASASS
jgi:hypothetical protein